MGFIYTFASSLDRKVFYVGKAASAYRILDHLYATRSKRMNVSRVALRIRSIWQQGGKIIIRYPYRCIPEWKIYQLEKEVIESYGYDQLVNLPPGKFGRDKGIFPRHWRKETIQKHIAWQSATN